LTNDIDLWLRTQNVMKMSAVSIRRLLQKKMVTQKKNALLSAGKKYVELTETPTVEKKAEKSREIACANHVTR